MLCRCDVLAKMDMSILVERNRKTLARPLFFSWITLRLSFQDQSSSFSASRYGKADSGRSSRSLSDLAAM